VHDDRVVKIVEAVCEHKFTSPVAYRGPQYVKYYYMIIWALVDVNYDENCVIERVPGREKQLVLRHTFVDGRKPSELTVTGPIN
jgi:hypothetical protein